MRRLRRVLLVSLSPCNGAPSAALPLLSGNAQAALVSPHELLTRRKALLPALGERAWLAQPCQQCSYRFSRQSSAWPSTCWFGRAIAGDVA